MKKTKPILILCPGYWGNATKPFVRWWFRHVIQFFSDEYEIVLVTFEGTSLRDYIAHAIEQVRDHLSSERPVYAIGFSAGAQAIRGISEEVPMAFKATALYSGLENFGVRVPKFFQAASTALWPLVRSLFTGTLRLDTLQQVIRIFLNATPSPDALAQELLTRHLHGERRMAVMQAATPGMRITLQGLECPTLVVVPRQDFFVDRATYEEDNVLERLDVEGDHSFITGEGIQNRMTLMAVHNFFHAHV